MKPPQPIVVIFWLVAIAAPFVVTAIALAQLPEGITEIPMQVGFDGEVTRMGAPGELWILSAIVAVCNALMAAAYFGNDFLFAHGLVHGTSKRGALRLYVALAVFLIVLQIGCTVFLVSQAV